MRTCKAVVRRLVGSFLDEGTSEGACEALDEAEPSRRCETVSDLSFDVQQQCERLKTVARQVLTALNQKPKTDNDKVNTIHSDPSTQVGLEEDTEGVKEGQEVEVSRLFVFGIRCKRKVTTLHCVGGCYRVQRLLFKQYELVMEKVPPQGSFTGLCWACWPNGVGTSGGTDASEQDGSTSPTSTRTSTS